MATDQESQLIKDKENLRTQIDFATMLLQWLGDSIAELKKKREVLLYNLKKLE